ncbi:hypothetical protein NDU88_005528 [Pleurodeles waltl]|uniref:Uncharacterized protein n=1 Tax=Pleurodeles waltl TaxID=8319 RepID=A0AAV7VNG2_PLEWA|nr:hypothetical protein NDU88_005528 [Pleurodeles waltl]
MCPDSYNRTSRRSKNDVPSVEEAVVAPSAREPEGARALEQEEQEPRSGTRERQRVKETRNKRRAALGAQCTGLGASATGSKQHLLEPSRQCRADRGNQKTVTLRVVVASIPFPGAPVYEEVRVQGRQTSSALQAATALFPPATDSSSLRQLRLPPPANANHSEKFIEQSSLHYIL